ncbi:MULTISPECIES: nitrous oxide reductase family maturation protein NosD [unclassified Streptomyces]|uniref:right-handed parallel beta-helix repeat-containing protein n=1 Tax=unclassified Streptomyces TaxID=2593676 RepID=UPI00225B3883|nr:MULTISPECIES: right-handed parallel beta-helix repeat-containing protein [unclassified Streptomyces]MCX4529131.1 right-handed parallel beta-helix repeat-containing protein [Streptomyces sp. NBC_01551]MCX4540186.1 right-handed parallel beta-helix repeat-containing protein [Streptomyces sp. NBC_01565]
MTNRQLKCLASISVVMATGIGAAAPSAGSAIHRVSAGQSIQAAVDAASPGDTVLVLPGTYQESVLITKRLTLRGYGQGRTVITPPATAPAAGNACAAAGNGICVIGSAEKSVERVTLKGLSVSGFAKSGIWASSTDRMRVEHVTAENNKVWGIAQQMSTRAVFRDNTARDNGESGLFIANTVEHEGGATDTLRSVIRDNTATGNRIGITVRRVRNLTVSGNTLTGNCGGVFVVGDEGTPRAGAMTVRDNQVRANNKFCPATTRLPAIQGSGIVLTGAEKTVVRGNSITDNVGSSPLSGGIVLFQSFVGAANTDNVIKDNVVTGNKSVDLANRGTGTGNTFTRNSCALSEPAGMC